MKTVILTPQIPEAVKNGGIGTFVSHFANLLVRSGHDDVTIIYTQGYTKPRQELENLYRRRGIKLKFVYDQDRPLDLRPGHDQLIRESELSDELIPEDTDVLYCADYRANGWIPARRRRYRLCKLPVIVTVIHGSSEWHRQGQQQWPYSFAQLSIDFAERYTAEHSDFVAAPTEYTLDWARRNSWKLPPDDRVSALGYPWLSESQLHPSSPPAQKFRSLTFFGRAETRKGFDLFVEALIRLKSSANLKTIEEIVILGQEGKHIYGTLAQAVDLLSRDLGIPVTTHTNLNTFEAQNYLREHVSDTLVVIPSRVDNMPFTVIEASLTPNLNFICSNSGGIPEIMREFGQHQLFDPEPNSLAATIVRWLEDGPRTASQLGRYDWEQANNRWLDFHQRVCDYHLSIDNTPAVSLPQPSSQSKSVDVCISYYNLGKYLPAALESLDQQTTDDFNVYIVNDGSTDTESTNVFEAMKQKYRPKGWYFIAQTNQGVCAARNLAALLGSAEYILFMDPDNVAAPNMVERFRDCIRVSGDDCLTSWMYMFSGDYSPYVGGRFLGTLVPPKLLYHPTGNYLPLGLLGNPYGDLNCIMRRSAFEAIGGFTMDYPKYVNKEDQELLTIISIRGYKMDVIPEYLFYYRHRTDSRLRTTDDFLSDLRILRVYEDKLRTVGMEDIAPLVVSLQYMIRDNVIDGGLPFRNREGSTFINQDDLLVNGIAWKDILRAVKNKFIKNVRQVLR